IVFLQTAQFVREEKSGLTEGQAFDAEAAKLNGKIIGKRARRADSENNNPASAGQQLDRRLELGAGNVRTHCFERPHVNVDHDVEGRSAFAPYRSKRPRHSRGRRQTQSEFVSELPSQIIEAGVTESLRCANDGRIACTNF